MARDDVLEAASAELRRAHLSAQVAEQGEREFLIGPSRKIRDIVAGHDIIVRTGPRDNPPPGSTLQLGFRPDAVHWFDAASGAAL